AVKERELREAEARAKQQTNLTESELAIIVQTNQGKADYARAQQQASQIQALAQAEAEKIRFLGEGEAKKIQALAQAEAERAARVGIAQAMAIEEQVRAYGGPRFQLTQQVMNRFAEAVEQARIDVVPKILIGGQAGSNGTNGSAGFGSGNVLEALLAILLSEKIGIEPSAPAAPASREAEALRSEMRARLGAKVKNPESPRCAFMRAARSRLNLQPASHNPLRRDLARRAGLFRRDLREQFLEARAIDFQSLVHADNVFVEGFLRHGRALAEAPRQHCQRLGAVRFEMADAIAVRG